MTASRLLPNEEYITQNDTTTIEPATVSTVYKDLGEVLSSAARQAWGEAVVLQQAAHERVIVRGRRRTELPAPAPQDYQ